MKFFFVSILVSLVFLVNHSLGYEMSSDEAVILKQLKANFQQKIKNLTTKMAPFSFRNLKMHPVYNGAFILKYAFLNIQIFINYIFTLIIYFIIYLKVYSGKGHTSIKLNLLIFN